MRALRPQFRSDTGLMSLVRSRYYGGENATVDLRGLIELSEEVVTERSPGMLYSHHIISRTHRSSTHLLDRILIRPHLSAL